jgi:hypothetical protein
VGGGLVAVVGLTARMIVEFMPSATWWVGMISMVVKPAVAGLAWCSAKAKAKASVM